MAPTRPKKSRRKNKSHPSLPTDKATPPTPTPSSLPADTAPVLAPEPSSLPTETAPVLAPEPSSLPADTAPVLAPEPSSLPADIAPVLAPIPSSLPADNAPVLAPEPSSLGHEHQTIDDSSVVNADHPQPGGVEPSPRELGHFLLGFAARGTGELVDEVNSAESKLSDDGDDGDDPDGSLAILEKPKIKLRLTQPKLTELEHHRTGADVSEIVREHVERQRDDEVRNGLEWRAKALHVHSENLQLRDRNSDLEEQLRRCKDSLSHMVKGEQDFVERLNAGEARLADEQRTVRSLELEKAQIESNLKSQLAEMRPEYDQLPQTQIGEGQMRPDHDEMQPEFEQASLYQQHSEDEQMLPVDELLQLQDRINQQVNTISELESSKATLSEQLQSAASMFEENKASLTRYENHFQQIESMKSELLEKDNINQEALRKANSDISTKNDDVLKLSADIQNSNTFISQLRENIFVLQNALTEATAKIAYYETGEVDIRRQLQEASKMCDDNSALSLEKESSYLASIENIQNKAAKDTHNLEAKIQSLEATIERQQEQQERTQIELDNVKILLRESSANADAKYEELQAHGHTVAELEENRKILKSNYDKKVQEHLDLKKELDECTKSLEDVEQKFNLTQNEYQIQKNYTLGWKADAAQQKVKVERLEKDLKETQAQLEKVNAIVEDLKASSTEGSDIVATTDASKHKKQHKSDFNDQDFVDQSEENRIANVDLDQGSVDQSEENRIANVNLDQGSVDQSEENRIANVNLDQGSIDQSEENRIANVDLDQGSVDQSEENRIANVNLDHETDIKSRKAADGRRKESQGKEYRTRANPLGVYDRSTGRYTTRQCWTDSAAEESEEEYQASLKRPKPKPLSALARYMYAMQNRSSGIKTSRANETTSQSLDSSSRAFDPPFRASDPSFRASDPSYRAFDPSSRALNPSSESPDTARHMSTMPSGDKTLGQAFKQTKKVSSRALDPAESMSNKYPGTDPRYERTKKKPFRPLGPNRSDLGMFSRIEPPRRRSRQTKKVSFEPLDPEENMTAKPAGMKSMNQALGQTEAEVIENLGSRGDVPTMSSDMKEMKKDSERTKPRSIAKSDPEGDLSIKFSGAKSMKHGAEQIHQTEDVPTISSDVERLNQGPGATYTVLADEIAGRFHTDSESERSGAEATVTEVGIQTSSTEAILEGGSEPTMTLYKKNVNVQEDVPTLSKGKSMTTSFDKKSSLTKATIGRRSEPTRSSDEESSSDEEDTPTLPRGRRMTPSFDRKSSLTKATIGRRSEPTRSSDEESSSDEEDTPTLPRRKFMTPSFDKQSSRLRATSRERSKPKSVDIPREIAPLPKERTTITPFDKRYFPTRANTGGGIALLSDKYYYKTLDALPPLTIENPMPRDEGLRLFVPLPIEQLNRDTGEQVDRNAEEQADRDAEEEVDRNAEEQVDRNAEEQVDRNAEEQTDRNAEKQIDRELAQKDAVSKQDENVLAKPADLQEAKNEQSKVPTGPVLEEFLETIRARHIPVRFNEDDRPIPQPHGHTSPLYLVIAFCIMLMMACVIMIMGSALSAYSYKEMFVDANRLSRRPVMYRNFANEQSLLRFLILFVMELFTG